MVIFMKRKIGIMGGTFNPIHNGHIKLAMTAYHQMNLDEVWFMPSGVSYLKKEDEILDKEVRAKMVDLAIEDYAFFRLSRIEIDREGNTYTIDTLRELKGKYQKEEFFFIMGADSLFSLSKWKEVDAILRLCTILVASRDGYNNLDLANKIIDIKENIYAEASIEILNFKLIDIASSEIRKLMIKKESVQDIIPSKVFDYIWKERLYTTYES